MKQERYKIDALARGLAVLGLFSIEQPALSLAEITTLSTLNKSTAFRIVATLEGLGFLELDPTTRRYRPGLAVLQLGFAALNNMDIRQLVRPHLEQLADQFEETASLAILDHNQRDIIYIDRVRNRAIVGVVLAVGSRLPAHAASLGKVLLADRSDAELAKWVSELPAQAFTEHTRTSEALLADLALIRQQGFATSDQELAVGLRGAAAAIRDSSGKAIAAMSISGSTSTLSLERLTHEVVPVVTATAQRISRALGGR
jgi:IclR family transcriptional regulator, pca regulon regulatory protein